MPIDFSFDILRPSLSLSLSYCLRFNCVSFIRKTFDGPPYPPTYYMDASKWIREMPRPDCWVLSPMTRHWLCWASYVYVHLLDKHRNDINQSKKLILITSRRDDNNIVTFFIDAAHPRAYYIVSSLSPLQL